MKKKTYIPSLRFDLSGVENPQLVGPEVAPWVTNEFEGDLRGRRFFFGISTPKRSAGLAWEPGSRWFSGGRTFGKVIGWGFAGPKVPILLTCGTCGFKVSEISPKIHDNDLWSCHGKVVWCFCFQLNYMIIWLAIRSVFRTKNCSSRDWTATDCEMRWAIQRWWLLFKFCGIFGGWRASWWVFVLVLRNYKSSVATGTGHLTFHANLYLYVWIWHEFCP